MTGGNRLLDTPTAFNWHSADDRAPNVCESCLLPEHRWHEGVCTEFMVPIEQVTSDAHDVPPPPGQLF